MKKFEEVTNKSSLHNEYFLIKNPDIMISDDRRFFSGNKLIKDEPLSVCWGLSRDDKDEVLMWMFQESYVKYMASGRDNHMYFRDGVVEGIELIGDDLQPSGVIADFLTEHPLN